MEWTTTSKTRYHDAEAVDLDEAPTDQAFAYDEDEDDVVYEEAYASYLDARRKFAEIRAGRGYYPMVALVDQQASVPPGQGKGKPGLSKGPSSGKGKGQSGKSGAARNPPSRAVNPLLHPAPMPLGVSDVDRLDTGPPSAHALLRLRLPRHPHHPRHSQSVNVKEKP